MNAHALLTAQGWRGHGHSLHKTDDAIGLSKPLLLNRKSNTKGLGVAQHFNNDQWWLNAFDEQLKGLEMAEGGTALRQTVTAGKLNTIQKGAVGRWSVYNSFVKGGFLEGTLSLLEKAETDSSPSSSGGESGDEGVKTLDSSEDSKDSALKEADTNKKETKEERRARKEAKRIRKEERAKRRADRRERKKAKAKGIDLPTKDESREEKRRRREKKKEKRRKREEERESKP